ncbi:hypothetical protein HK096_009954, partial [Nowakowskiella sp. JEL0078]
MYSFCVCPNCSANTTSLPVPIAEAFQSLVELAGSREFIILFSKFQEYVLSMFAELNGKEEDLTRQLLSDCGLDVAGMTPRYAEMDAGVIGSVGLGDCRRAFDTGYVVYRHSCFYFDQNELVDQKSEYNEEDIEDEDRSKD